MLQQAFLDLGWKMVLAAAAYPLFDTAGEGNIAAHIHLAQNFCMQPSFRVNSLGDVALGLSWYSSMTQGFQAQISSNC